MPALPLHMSQQKALGTCTAGTGNSETLLSTGFIISNKKWTNLQTAKLTTRDSGFGLSEGGRQIVAIVEKNLAKFG